MRRGVFRQYAYAWEWMFRASDVTIIVLSFVLTYVARFNSSEMPARYWIAVLLCVLIANVVFSAAKMYSPWRGKPLYTELALLFWSWAVVVLVLTLVSFLTQTGDQFSRLWFAWSATIAFTVMCLQRVVVRRLQHWMRERGFNKRRVVMLGAGNLGKDVAGQIEANRWAGLEVVGFFDDSKDLQNKSVLGIPVLGTLDDVARHFDVYRNAGAGIYKRSVDYVWIALPLRAEQRIKEVYERLRRTNVSICFVPDIFGFALMNHSVEDIAHIPVLNLSVTPISGSTALLKRVEDILVAAVAILLTAPLMALVAAAIKLESRGPVFYPQRRFGLDGRELIVHKFRSMSTMDSDDEVQCSVRTDGVLQHGSENDTRVTRVGAFLRKYSIDELPQFFDVLRGDMSVVGPRPHAVKIDREYGRVVDFYYRRQLVKPGITGWAQVNGWRGNTSIDKRVEHDIQYINNWSLLLDFKIVLLTIFGGFTGKSAY